MIEQSGLGRTINPEPPRASVAVTTKRTIVNASRDPLARFIVGLVIGVALGLNLKARIACAGSFPPNIGIK